VLRHRPDLQQVQRQLKEAGDGVAGEVAVAAGISKDDILKDMFAKNVYGSKVIADKRLTRIRKRSIL